MTRSGACAAPIPGPPDHGLGQLVNLRDLGGLPLAAGGVTRPGVLYRSDAPYPGDGIPDSVPVWPPATVIDLRSPGEGAPGYAWPAGVSVHQVPLTSRAAVVTDSRQDAGGALPRELPSSVEALYLQVLEAVPHLLASCVAIAANSPSPVLVHCTAGKDRTGMTVALLLLVGGVEPEAVMADYTATAPNMSALLRRLQGLGRQLRIDADSVLLTAPAKAISMVIEKLTGWPGGPQAWARSHGALPADVRRWQDRLAANGPARPGNTAAR
jgi:protein-tyrosine phosphatase